MKKVVSLISVLCIALAYVSGCNMRAALPQNPALSSTSANPSASAPEQEQTAETTTAPSTENPVMTMPSDIVQDDNSDNVNNSIFNEDGKIVLVGYYLDDAIDILRACGIDKAYIKYESDNGDMIIVTNNWEVVSQRIEGRKVVLSCTKTRSDGIFDAVGEVIDDMLGGIEKLNIAAKDFDEILELFNI